MVEFIVCVIVACVAGYIGYMSGQGARYDALQKERDELWDSRQTLRKERDRWNAAAEKSEDRVRCLESTICEAHRILIRDFEVTGRDHKEGGE